MSEPDRLPGGVLPSKRLPVTPDSARDLLDRARSWRPPSAFPFTAPTWPGEVPRPPLERTLGTDYDSDWARRYPARLGRVVAQEFLARPVVAALARPRISGLDRIAHLDEPVIFAANHASHIDAPLLLAVIPERWRHRMVVAGAADYFFDTRVKAVAFSFLINAVPIERTRVSRDSARRVTDLLDDGWSLLIFPEGGRSQDGWGQSHKPGAAWLAVRTGRPVIPVFVDGTAAILPRGSTRMKPGPTHVTFGHPLRPGGARSGPGDARELADELERAIAALADEHTTDWWTSRRRAAARTSPSLTGPEAGAWRRAWALGERRRRPSRPGGGGAAGGGSGRWPRS